MNDGNTSGSGARTRHNDAMGRSVRVSSHASDTPIDTVAVGHEDGELHRSPGRSERLGEHLAAVPAEGERPPGDVHHRGGERHGDGDGRRGGARRVLGRIPVGRAPARFPAPARRPRCRRARPAAIVATSCTQPSSPASRIMSRVVSRSTPRSSKSSSMSLAAARSTSGSTSAGSTPVARGYSNVSSVK